MSDVVKTVDYTRSRVLLEQITFRAFNESKGIPSRRQMGKDEFHCLEGESTNTPYNTKQRTSLSLKMTLPLLLL